MKKRHASDLTFTTILYIVMFFFLVVTLYPFLNSLALSLNDSIDTMKGGITIFPRLLTLKNYELIFENSRLGQAYFISILRTVLGTISSLIMTGLFSYALSKSDLIGRKVYNIILVIPMYFGGGLIPTFLLMRTLGLIDNFLVYIIPNLVGIWNVIIMRTYFKALPVSLEESALIDGAGYFKIFFRLVFPLSAPIIATIALFIAVGQWNSWFDAFIYINDENLKPVMTVLIQIVNSTKSISALLSSHAGSSVDVSAFLKKSNINTRSITMATMMVTVVPIIIVYPFLQKYFMKGIMIGSLKG